MPIAQAVARRVLLKLFTTGTTTAATGKTVAITLSKAGGAFANPAAGTTNATELANGWYYVDLGTGDTDTAGDLVVRGTATGCDDSERLFGVGDSGLTASVVANEIGMMDPSSFDPGQFGYDAAQAAPAVGAIADAVWDEALSGHATTGTAGKVLSDAAAGGGGTAPTASENAAAVWSYLTTTADALGVTAMGRWLRTSVQALATAISGAVPGVVPPPANDLRLFAGADYASGRALTKQYTSARASDQHARAKKVAVFRDQRAGTDVLTLTVTTSVPEAGVIAVTFAPTATQTATLDGLTIAYQVIGSENDDTLPEVIAEGRVAAPRMYGGS